MIIGLVFSLYFAEGGSGIVMCRNLGFRCLARCRIVGNFRRHVLVREKFEIKFITKSWYPDWNN